MRADAGRRPGAWRRFLPPLMWLLLLALAVWRFDLLEGPLKAAFGSKSALRERAPLSDYLWQHVALSVSSIGLSAALGLALGMLLSLKALREYRSSVAGAATFLQSVPSAAFLALSVPALGYGQGPVLLALTAYGLLPILRGAARGLGAAPGDALETGEGMGMTPGQLLLRVRWPLALPSILSGIRTSAIVTISAATLGATVGAGGLGVLIVNGIRAMDPVLIVKGALPVSLLALLTGSVFNIFEAKRPWQGR